MTFKVKMNICPILSLSNYDDLFAIYHFLIFTLSTASCHGNTGPRPHRSWRWSWESYVHPRDKSSLSKGWLNKRNTAEYDHRRLKTLAICRQQQKRPTNDFNDIIHGGVFNMDFLNMNPQNTWTNCSFGRRASISTSPLQEGPIGVVWHHWHQVMTNDLFGKSKLTNGMLYIDIYIIAVCPSSRSEEYCTHPSSRSKLRYL